MNKLVLLFAVFCCRRPVHCASLSIILEMVIFNHAVGIYRLLYNAFSAAMVLADKPVSTCQRDDERDQPDLLHCVEDGFAQAIDIGQCRRCEQWLSLMFSLSAASFLFPYRCYRWLLRIPLIFLSICTSVYLSAHKCCNGFLLPANRPHSGVISRNTEFTSTPYGH